jgi:hypothetical protein
VSRECRNCRSSNTVTLDQGLLSPFFMKRVYGMRLMSITEAFAEESNTSRRSAGHSLASWLLGLLWKRSLMTYRSPVRVDIRVCQSCRFVGPEVAYTLEMLSGLYGNYRSESYNAERAVYEPNYNEIRDYVGKSNEEISSRMSNLDDIIGSCVDANEINNVIDWGGGEGRFIPTAFRAKNVWVLDVSSEPLVSNSFHRISQVPEGVKFEYAQICHVLEHIASPYEFVKNIIPHISDRGYIYIEVPQDRSEQDIQRFVHCDPSVRHYIHEHLNLFSMKSIEALALALGLGVMYLERKRLDLGWAAMDIISTLLKK